MTGGPTVLAAVAAPSDLCAARDKLIADVKGLCAHLETGLTLVASDDMSGAERQRGIESIRRAVRQLSQIAVSAVERATDAAELVQTVTTHRPPRWSH